MEKLSEGQRTSIPTWYVRSGSAFVSLTPEGGEGVRASSPSTLLRDVQDRLRDKVISGFGLCYSGNAALLATFFSRLLSEPQLTLPDPLRYEAVGACRTLLCQTFTARPLSALISPHPSPAMHRPHILIFTPTDLIVNSPAYQAVDVDKGVAIDNDTTHRFADCH